MRPEGGRTGALSCGTSYIVIQEVTEETEREAGRLCHYAPRRLTESRRRGSQVSIPKWTAASGDVRRRQVDQLNPACWANLRMLVHPCSRNAWLSIRLNNARNSWTGCCGQSFASGHISELLRASQS